MRRVRSTGSLSDPVLRILVTSTAVGRIGRGVFLAVTVLYFTRIVGLSAGEIAVVLTVSAGLGVAASALTGHLADRISARRILLAGMTLDGVALVAYAFAADFWAVLAIGAVVGVAESAANAARMAIIARAFDGPRRVSARAILRTVTNISIAAGAAAGGLSLLADTGLAYRAAIVAAGLVVLAGVPIMRGLPPRVDAPRVVPAAPAADSAVPTAAGTATAPPATPVVRRASPWRDARYLALTALSAVAWLAVALLIAAALAHAFAEVMSQAGGWGLSFELADPRAPGAYQGVFSMGFNLGAMAAPIVVTAALGLGLAGWALLAVVFAASALGTTLIAWRSAKGLDAADRRVRAA